MAVINNMQRKQSNEKEISMLTTSDLGNKLMPSKLAKKIT
jgi:hypothetical protein